MKRLLLLSILVIILVSLNWFAEVYANDLSSLSEDQKAALRARYLGGQVRTDENRSNSGIDYYKSPEFFDDSSRATMLVDGELDTTSHEPKSDRLAGTYSEIASDQIPFEALKPFGQDLFGIIQPGLAISGAITTSSDYVLGPSDNVIIYLWGRVEKEYNLTLDREGKIIIPGVGEIRAWGLSLAAFKESTRRRLSKVYSDFDLTVSLGKIRSIRIYLTGEVKKPGAYTVSSLTSLFNALYLAGGPGENGSMRRIRLMRSGEMVAEIDLYRFLLEGDNSLDVRLRTGDAIFVPVVGHRVAIRGQVRRPALYELVGDETITDLLTLAGSTTAEAYLDRVMLERVASREEWEVLDLNLNAHPDQPVDNEVLLDGDRITVFSIYDAKKNMVGVYGHVQHPGRYERNDSSTVAELIERAGLQPYDVNMSRANLFRRYSDWRTEIVAIDLELALKGDPGHNLQLHDKDSLHIYSLNEVSWKKYVYIEGEVSRPGEYPLYDGMSVPDLIFLAGSYTRSATLMRAELARTDAQGEVSLVYVDLSPDQGSHLELAEGDRLFIRQIPNWRSHRTVVLEGEVAYPGEYVMASADETLYQLMQRAGGFSQSAFPRGLVFERNTIDRSLERLRIPQQLKNSSELVRDTLGNLGQSDYFDYDPTMVNRIILDVEKLMASKGHEGDVVLEPGDKIFVPPIPSGITVMGAVGSTGTIQFSKNKNVKYYVNRAGSYSQRADKSGTRLIRANGEVYNSGAMGKRVELGDVIVVPSKIKQQRKSLIRSLGTIFTTTAGLLTTILLIDRL